VVFFTLDQIGYFFTIFASKKVPCFLVMYFLIVHNYLTFYRNKFWTPSFSIARKSTIPTLNFFNAQTTTRSKMLHSRIVIVFFFSFVVEQINKNRGSKFRNIIMILCVTHNAYDMHDIQGVHEKKSISFK